MPRPRHILIPNGEAAKPAVDTKAEAAKNETNAKEKAAAKKKDTDAKEKAAAKKKDTDAKKKDTDAKNETTPKRVIRKDVKPATAAAASCIDKNMLPPINDTMHYLENNVDRKR